MRVNDAILGLLILAGGLAIILEASTFPETHGQAYGPDLFPTIIGAGLVLAGVVLMVSGWRARQAAGWVTTVGIPPARMLDAGLVLAAILVFIFLADVLGFLIAGGVPAWALMARFNGGRWLSSLAIAVVTVLAVDWAFRTLLLVPLPQGEILPMLPW